jgi:hypothetical protein
MKTLGGSQEPSQVQVEKKKGTVMTNVDNLTLSTGLGHLAPMFSFSPTGKGSGIPLSTRKGSTKRWRKAPLSGNPVLGTCMVLCDGSSHAIDSSELVFQLLHMI